MAPSARNLSPSEAAHQLGISTKALRHYEQRGLINPSRTQSGWRVYGPGEMARGAEIVALRNLGLSLAQVQHVLNGCPGDLDQALAANQASFEKQMKHVAGTLEKISQIRQNLALGRTTGAEDLIQLLEPALGQGVTFDLPWPWGGERFELHGIRPLNFITGPLGSGKTRLAKCLYTTLVDAAFFGMDRFDQNGAAILRNLDVDSALNGRVDRALAWLAGEGAASSDALRILVTTLESEGPGNLVIDMIEQGLDADTQAALMAHLRRSVKFKQVQFKSVFMLTRSTAILDLSQIGSDETIIYCPANHSPPILVIPHRGALGFEAVTTCLATPDVRARTEGVRAVRAAAN